MNSKLKKRCIRCGALMAATAVVAGIFFQTTLSVEAAMEKMPGIETIVKDNSKDKPFRILELTDNSEDAEIGYYISGQEPSVKLYTYEYQDVSGNTQTVHFQTFEEGLAKLPEIQRKEFVMNVKLDENGNINADASTGIQKINMTASDADTAPLSYSDYQEKYFLDNSDRTEDWTKIDLTDLQGKNRIDTVKINGTYQENAAGNGNYTKEEQKYYPIREGVESDQQQPEKFRENIESFSYVEAESDDDRAAYFLQFAPVNNSDVNAAFSDDKPTAQAAQQKIQEAYDATAGNYGYYENVYTDLTEEITDNLSNKKFTFPGENPGDDVSNALLIRNHQLSTAGQTTSLPVLGGIQDADLAGSQEDPYIYLGKNIDSYPYYQYALVGDLKYVIQKAQESAAADTQAVDETDGSEAASQAMAATADPQDGDTKITLEDGQYWYWQFDATDNVWTKTVLSIVTGRQAVSYQDVQKLPDTLGYNYYYQVDKVWFCCQAGSHADSDATSAKYYGWYYPSYPAGEDVYLPVDSDSQEVPTYYISEAAYTLTPGTGDYDFVPGGTEEKYVQVNAVYYRGGYTNYDWLKRDVFHLDPMNEDGEENPDFNNFTISVDTRLASDWTKAVYASGSGGTESLFEEAGDINLEDYDFVYINGQLSEDIAQRILDSQLPCMVNTSRGINDVFHEIFAAYLKSSDADGSYVSYQMYFYKNIFLPATGGGTTQIPVPESLINSDFNKKFSGTQQQGFEDITKYIDQENEYRALGKKDDGTDTTMQLSPLSQDLSMARALEYIINYPLKRNIVSKSTINVLEIMPDKDCRDYTNLGNQVYQWLGLNAPKVTYTVCCSQSQNGYGVEKLHDSDINTYWESKWNNNANDDKHERNEHYIKVSFDDQPASVSGFSYTPRQGAGTVGQQNGVLKKWTVVLKKADGSTETQTGTTKFTEWDRTEQSFYFDKTISDVTEMTLFFDDALVYGSGRTASCAELNILYGNIQVTSMTAAEFVGHVDDIASKYDMIYIDGTRLDSSNSLLTGAGNLCYSHVGDVVGITATNRPGNLLKLLGQLDNEYDANLSPDGKRRFATINTYSPDGGGYFRGSGNDMTAQQCQELLDFVKSGYPVIVGAGLISNHQVNTNKVDDTSYYYEFLKNAIGYKNVVSVSELSNQNTDLSFFANLAKPTITFAENGKPAEPERLNTTGGAYVDGELKYVFTIGNDSDASPALTTYDCKLYLDLNFDGNLSSKEEQEKYMVIQDENGKVVSQVDDGDGNYHYALQAGRQYTLTRKLPSDYFKLITWKLEVSSNKNAYIHTSETGYAKQKNTGSPQTINVLQIVPKNCTWTLTNDAAFKNKIDEVNRQGDFNLNITQVTVAQVNKMKKGEMEQLLSTQQMLIIGFADVYDDISDADGQVQAILAFIRSGKSVLFSHDTTSYINYDWNQMYGKIATTKYNSNSYWEDGDEDTDIYYDGYLHRNYIDNVTWGLSLNTVLRSVVGMDRYSITSDATLSDGNLVSDILKKGQPIKDSVTLKELMEKAGDVAWQNNSEKSTSYAQTQGYSNLILQGQEGSETERATKVNDGAITQYPYVIGDTISVSTTHGQYYQLGLEQDNDINGNSDGKTDVVVWYCLTDGNYANSPNDARNNYYFYSKGNVIYTGAGHSQVEKTQEIELFINAMVAAANVTAVDPDIDFVDTLSPNADTEAARYYATNETAWTDGESNVLEKSMDFYVNVKDYNMVSADLSQDDLDNQEMTLEFFIDSDEGKVENGAPTLSKILNITDAINSITDYDGSVTQIGSDHKFHLSQNNAYALTLSNPEKYLRIQNFGEKSYRTDCKLYAKVTSTVYLYGEPKTSISWASIDLKQRQLFELN